MPDRIIHKRSLTPGSVPATSSLSLGEIAINVNDGRLFIRQSGSVGDVTVSPIMPTQTASFATTGSNTFIGNQIITGSITLTGSFNHLGNYTHNGIVYHSGSKYLVGIFSQTGSLSITGSTTQIGSNNLFGNTSLSGSITISGSLSQGTPTVGIFGDTNLTGYLRMLPVVTNINTSISASYIYVSGSTQDLYFSQNGKGYTNVTRLRWLEGNLYTGIFNGGLITTQSATVYQVGSGSGVIVNLNASINDNPYPTVQYLNWNNLSASIAPLSASYDQSFVAIDSTTNITVQGTPYQDGDFNTKMPIGVVVHQNHSTINAVQTFPGVAYGWKQRSYDFIRAFGPLKISGYTLSPSGSSSGSLVLSGGTSWVDGRNYIVDPNNPSYIVEANGIVASKIYRYRQSGSVWAYDTNNGAGYATIDPTQYSNNGVLTSVGTNDWSIQRVFYFPNSATKAFYIYYGNATYSSQAAALAAVATETFTEAPNTAANAIYVGFMLLRHNANFTNAASYTIYQSSLFRAAGSGGGAGGGTTAAGGSNTQIQYNNAGVFGGVTNLTWNGTTLVGTGSFSGSFTGTLIGSASWATNALTASNAPSYVLNSVTSSMLSPYILTSVTSSMSVLSSSYARSAVTASKALSYTETDPVYTAASANIAFVNTTNTFQSPQVIQSTLSLQQPSTTYTEHQIAAVKTTAIKSTTTNILIVDMNTANTPAIHIKYVLYSTGTVNVRAGNLMIIGDLSSLLGNGSTVNYTETTTTDIGDTRLITLQAIRNVGNPTEVLVQVVNNDTISDYDIRFEYTIL